MKTTNVSLIPLTSDDREEFILENQRAFKHGALYEFGERDNHINADGEIISRKTIEMCMDDKNAETYRIVLDGRTVGGMILHINEKTKINELDTLPHQTNHMLRHTFCTRMIEKCCEPNSGINIKIVQKLMGHNDAATTLNIYTEVSKEFLASINIKYCK